MKRIRRKLCVAYIGTVALLLATSAMLQAIDDTSAWNQILALKDKSPWNSAAVEVQQYPESVSMVNQLINNQGAGVILKLLNSSSQDDYLRQVTIAGALKAKYTYQDLPTLCAIERALSSLPTNAHEVDRRWIEPQIAQLRIADWIEFLSRIPDAERVSKSELVSNVDSWIQKTVGIAKSHSQNSSETDVLSRCLVK